MITSELIAAGIANEYSPAKVYVGVYNGGKEYMTQVDFCFVHEYGWTVRGRVYVLPTFTYRMVMNTLRPVVEMRLRQLQGE